MIERLKDSRLLGAALLGSLLIPVFFPGEQKPKLQYTEPQCWLFVHETLGAEPGDEAHAIYRKIHTCVDEGFLPREYKQIYQM